MDEEERKKLLSKKQQSFGSKFLPKEAWPEEMFDDAKDKKEDQKDTSKDD